MIAALTVGSCMIPRLASRVGPGLCSGMSPRLVPRISPRPTPTLVSGMSS